MKKLLAVVLAALAIAAHGQTLVRPLQGGTGVSQANTKTITLGGPLVTSGAFTTTFTATGTTTVTLPLSGTLLSTGSSIALSNLATQATNTVVGNATAGAAVPTALAVGSCSTSGSALIWTTNTGFGCNTSIVAASATGNAGTVTVADAGADTTTWVLLGTSQTGSLAPATDAGLTYNANTNALTATTFLGALTGDVTGNVTGNASGTAATVTGATQAAITTAANLTTVGTITSGTWDGTDIAVTAGGTGRSTSTTAYGLLAAGTTATGVHQTLAAGATTEILVGGGAAALPVWTTATGTGAPMRAGSPTTTGTLTADAVNALGLLNVDRSAGSSGTSVIQRFTSNAAQRNWQIGANLFANNLWSISASTAAGGTTFTSDVFSINSAAAAIIAGGTGTLTLDSSTGAASQASIMTMTGGTSRINWRFGSNIITNDLFELIPSTAAGGSTFTTPVMSHNSTGDTTFLLSAISPLFRSTTAKVLVRGTGTGATQLAATQTTAPTCSSNCGTGSPTVTGTDTFMTVQMGSSGVPASGWVVTFNGTWAAAPSCVVQMGKAGMVVGKLVLTAVTTTTTITAVTNGTAPSTGDIYHIHCGGTQ